MSKTMNNKIWVSRDIATDDDYVDVWFAEPIWDENYKEFMSSDKAYFHFGKMKMDGIKMNECKCFELVECKR